MRQLRRRGSTPLTTVPFFTCGGRAWLTRKGPPRNRGTPAPSKRTWILFFLWPSHGPYYLSASHFAELPHTLRTYTSQQRLLANAQVFWEHKGKDRIGLDYYIAFPCMHIAQPLIVMWFLRKWKRIVGFLVGVDVLLLAPVLLLEWHYVVDLLGGVVVALLAIGIVDGWGSYPQPTDSPLQS